MLQEAEVFDEYRPLLFSIAYRMLGSAMDAEDIVQEAFLRWHKVHESEVQSPKAYLTTIVTRLCIDQMRSAKAQREVYVGPWLPEPIMTENDSSMTETAELAESLSIAFLVVLESLSPVERAVFLLREIFDYDYSEIAHIVEKSEDNCRQMVRRAKQHLAERRPRYQVSAEQRQQMTHQFMQACLGGDMEGLVALLTEDIVSRSDGGGKTRAALNPIYGREKVARFMLGLVKKTGPGYRLKLVEINGQSSMVAYVDNQPVLVLELDLTDQGIRALHLVVNPDKLKGIENFDN